MLKMSISADLFRSVYELGSTVEIEVNKHLNIHVF